ncbi:MAG TPA: FimV/HubP family polar landmark protein [Rhodanobacter sp.]
MNRSLKLSMLMALALGSSQALALDLGQIQVKSALGQPLLAEIPLHPANPAELRNLTVQLASSEDFARAGISGGRTAIPLHFSVTGNGSGQQVIRITSSVAVDDPYLDLLLEVNGGAGKSVREFTILLDPPGASSPAAEVSAQTRVARRTAPVPPKEPRAAAAPASHARHVAVAGNGQYGPVQSGQTLSGIARNTALAGVDVHQMLLALKQANPDAFYRDNINALKSGVVLRVPTSAEAQAMEVAAAVAEVRRQNSDWRAGTASKPGVVADAGTRPSASSSPTAGKSDNAGDRLALVPAKEGNSNGTQGDTAGTKGDKSSAAMRQDLLRTQESLASLQQQATDLKTRLKDLTDINSKNERLLSLKDNEIAELQNKLAAARKGAGLPVTPPAPESKPAMSASTPVVAMAPARAATVATATASKAASMINPPASAPVAASTAAPKPAATASASAAGAPASSASSTKTPPKPASKPATRAAAPQPVAEDPWYMQTWAWAVGAGVIVLLVLAALLGRRKPASAAGSAASLADRFGSDASAERDFDGDDVDQEELLDQLAEHPDDIGLHLELVTLYYSRRDVDHFEAAAEAMHAHITDPQQDEWQDVVHMGEDLVPGHPLFDHHAELPVSEETEARRAFDIDDYASHEASPAMPPLPAAAKKVSEYSFNFDLTSAVHGSASGDKPAAGDVDEQVHHETPAAADELVASWQFDEPAHALPSSEHTLNEFSDDPVDTKLDLARAYLDMGDAEGARAMLGEALKEGSQMQQDVARRLLESLN